MMKSEMIWLVYRVVPHKSSLTKVARRLVGWVQAPDDETEACKRAGVFRSSEADRLIVERLPPERDWGWIER
jgi:hypothetical protein